MILTDYRVVELSRTFLTLEAKCEMSWSKARVTNVSVVCTFAVSHR